MSTARMSTAGMSTAGMSSAGMSSAGLSNAPATTQQERSAKLLPTTVIGSFAVPEWLGQLRNDYYQRRISRRYLGEILDMATKAAIVDQDRAGIDIISDGELRRDNDVDYVLPRCPASRSSARPRPTTSTTSMPRSPGRCPSPPARASASASPTTSGSPGS
jgi:Cobalamin-independent synthase, Catalytic domain